MTVKPPADDVISHQESAVVLDGGKLNLAGTAIAINRKLLLMRGLNPHSIYV